MAFAADEMHFSTVCPAPERLAALTAESALRTPDKVRRVMGELVFPVPPEDRPYLYGCMVLSFDGKMGFPDDPEGTLISKENRLDPVGGKTDFWIMNVCRTYADGVIMGSGTLRARMNKMWYAQISDPELSEARAGLGRRGAEPLGLIATADGLDVPVEHPIFTRAEQPAVLTSRAGAERLRRRLTVPSRVLEGPEDLRCGSSEVRILAAGEEQPDTRMLLSLLRRCGLEYVSVEAPGYLWHLIREGVLDEYMLNYSGVMAGGATALGTGAGFTVERHPHAELLSVGWHRGFLYTRQKLHYEAPEHGGERI